MGNRWGRIGYERDEAADVGALRADVNELKDAAKKTTGRPLNEAEIDNTVLPTFRLDKKRTHYYVTLGFKGPAEMVSLTARIVPTAKRTDQATFNQNKFEGHVAEFDDQQRVDLSVGGTVRAELDAALDPNTQYDIFRLIAFFQDGSAVDTPGVDVAFNDPPLFQFTTPTSTANAPSKPTLARIVGNTVDDTADGVVGTVTLRIYADETQLLTFSAQGTDRVQPRIIKVADGKKAPSPPTNIDDPTATFVDIAIGDLQIGREYQWPKNTAFSGNDASDALATSTISFFAGGYRDPSDGLALLTQNSYTATASESGTQLLLDLSLTQPTPPYRLKNTNLERSKSGGPFVDQNVNFGLQDPIYNTPGTIHIYRTVDIHPTRTYQYRETIKSVGSFTKQFTTASITTSSPTVAAQLSAQGGGPSLIIGGSLQASIKDDNDLNNPPGAAGDAIYPMRLWETAANSTVRIDNKAVSGGGSADAAGVRWDSANARLECETNIVTLGGKPAVRIGKLLHKNDVVVLCPSFLAASADVTVNIAFALVDQGSGDMVVETAASFLISHTTEQRGLWILIVPNSYAGTGRQWVELRFGSNPSQKVYTWNWELDYAEVYRDFKINGDEKAVLDFLDVAPMNSALAATGIITESANGDLFSRSGTKAGPISLQ